MVDEEIFEKIKEIFEKIKNLFRELGFANTIELNHHLINTYNIDEIDRIELAMELEELFDIDISDQEAEDWTTVESVVDFISSKRIVFELNSEQEKCKQEISLQEISLKEYLWKRVPWFCFRDHYGQCEIPERFTAQKRINDLIEAQESLEGEDEELIADVRLFRARFEVKST